MQGPAPILTLARARLPLEPAGGLTAPLDLSVLPDELVLLDLAEPRRATAFADAACGCLPAAEGSITFLRRDWREETPEKAHALRGRIGRLFAEDAWLPWLTVADNVMLAVQYHTRIPRTTLLAQAARLAERFGLPGLPLDFAEALAAPDLARAALVRAFLDAPRLVLLENPTGLLGQEILPGLLASIRSVRDDGGAVLWLTHGGGPLMDRTVPATQRWRLAGSRLVTVAARAA